jgi:hypothetical protein
MRLLGRLVVVGLLSLGGCQTLGGPSDATRPITISGRVLDFGTDAPVAGASVAFSGDPGRVAGAATAITDGSGTYTLTVPTPDSAPANNGSFPWYILVDGVSVGRARLATSGYRGDLLVRPGTCVTRYGVVVDATVRRAVAGATVTLLGRSVTTGSDGWYRIDFGCPSEGSFGFNTTFLYASHPAYPGAQEIVGRGVFGTQRIDIEMTGRVVTR